jgi:ABC-type uncharacterized transport system permease subunit
MVISSASIVFSAASAFLFLLSDRYLKQKRVLTVLGRVPNTAWLRHANAIGLKSSFACLTLGLASGIGMATVRSASMHMRIMDWLVDPKIICIAAAWLLLAVILCMHRCARLSDKVTAYATVAAFVLILFAFVGVALLGNTVHMFSKDVEEVHVSQCTVPGGGGADLEPRRFVLHRSKRDDARPLSTVNREPGIWNPSL